MHNIVHAAILQSCKKPEQGMAFSEALLLRACWGMAGLQMVFRGNAGISYRVHVSGDNSSCKSLWTWVNYQKQQTSLTKI